jgi:hypothetical protein
MATPPPKRPKPKKYMEKKMKKLFGKQGRLTKKQFGKAKKKNGPR